MNRRLFRQISKSSYVHQRVCPAQHRHTCPKFSLATPSKANVLGLLPLQAAGNPELPSALIVLSIIAGLPAALWVYKCLMMIVFQRRIIYMGYAPLGSRKESIKTDVDPRHLHGILCEEIQVPNPVDKVQLAGILIRPEGQKEPPDSVIIYLQGNAGNPLHRLPVFQQLLHAIRIHAHSAGTPSLNPSTVIIAIAPRSYWKSTLRSPTQAGILSDYTHVIQYASMRFPHARVILYGHSLGGAIAVCLLSKLDEATRAPEAGLENPSEAAIDSTRIKGLILENPFASIPGMLAALYPQRWVPYRHLAPCVWDTWDALGAMRSAAAAEHLDIIPDKTLKIGDRANQPEQGTAPTSALGRLARNALVLVSEHDEVVPRTMGAQIVQAALGIDSDDKSSTVGDGVRRAELAKNVEKGSGTRLVVIPGALHENAWNRRGWAEAVGPYIRDVMKKR